MNIYLASPFFNIEEKNIVLKAVKILRNCGHNVFVPMEHEIENAWLLSNEDWAKQVFEMDIQAIDNCDEVVVLDFGLYSDSGTAWECGYAFAKGKKITTVSLTKGDSSIMIINGSHSHKQTLGGLKDLDFKTTFYGNQK